MCIDEPHDPHLFFLVSLWILQQSHRLQNFPWYTLDLGKGIGRSQRHRWLGSTYSITPKRLWSWFLSFRGYGCAVTFRLLKSGVWTKCEVSIVQLPTSGSKALLLCCWMYWGSSLTMGALEKGWASNEFQQKRRIPIILSQKSISPDALKVLIQPDQAPSGIIRSFPPLSDFVCSVCSTI